jgi:hypothetical protein
MRKSATDDAGKPSLEFACQPEDGEAPAVIPCITPRKSEAHDELATLPDVTVGWIEMRLAALPE